MTIIEILDVSEFRVLPIPHPSGARMAQFYARVEHVPAALTKWLSVNPRVPKQSKSQKLSGPVAKAMLATLSEEPENFAIKNNGIFVTVEEVDYHKDKGSKGTVRLRLSDEKAHGVVNGGHTLLAIQQHLNSIPGGAAEDSAPLEGEPELPSCAFVRFHIMEGMGDHITELAEGLNRSMQVDNPSLENLKGTFTKLQESLQEKVGADQIAYRQGDTGDVDVLFVLTLLGMFNLNDYPDRKKFPNGLFGQTKKVLDTFVEDLESDAPVFGRLIPCAHNILVLADEIRRHALMQTGDAELGKLKISSAKKENRVGSPRFDNQPAHFAGGTYNGKFMLGWLYPMVAAFRAAMSKAAWDDGRVEWLVKPQDLLPEVIEEMTRIVKQEHVDNNNKPAEVGRKEAAYRACYSVVKMALADRGDLESS